MYPKQGQGGAPMNDAIGITFIIGSFFAYCIPAFVAYGRQHTSAGAITVLNLFLGWSLVGWVAALVWACTNPGSPQSNPSSTPSSPPQRSSSDEIKVLADLRDRGILTEEEFEAKKMAILSEHMVI